MYFLPLHPGVLLRGVSHARLPPMWSAVSNPGIDAICWLSLLLVFSLAPRGFSPGTSIRFPLSSKTNTFNSNSIWNARTRFHEFLRNPKCSVEAGDLCYKKDQPNFVIHWKEIYPVDSAIIDWATAAWFLNALHFFRRNHFPESRPEFGCYSPQAWPTPVDSPGLYLSFM